MSYLNQNPCDARISGLDNNIDILALIRQNIDVDIEKLKMMLENVRKQRRVVSDILSVQSNHNIFS